MNIVSSTHYDDAIAAIYAQMDHRDTGLIAYRDLPKLLKSLRKTKNDRALDFGCGSGFSTFLLVQAGFNTIGVDPNKHMLNQARSRYPSVKFEQITPSRTEFWSHSFELILCAFVLLELSSIEAIKEMLREFLRLLKPGGNLIVITASEHFPKHDWLTAQNTVRKNQTLTPGQNYRVLRTKNHMVFSDFFYDDSSYRTAFKETGFIVNDLYQPKGQLSDGIEWTTEWDLPPYSIYLCSPTE